MTEKNAILGDALYSDTIPGGCHWSMRVKQGKTLRLIDVEGGANVGMLFYNPNDLLERYNAPDTLKCQHTFKLTSGHCLYSDMGRIFCSITDDSFGWHDTVCGNLSKKMIQERWGEKTYQDSKNDWTRSGYDSFLVELAKYGLGRRDMAANLNFFSKVVTDEEGNLSLDGSASRAGAYVDLRFEMDTLVVFHTCPHPLNFSDAYPKKPLRYEFYNSAPVAEDDLCKNSCGENQRGFKNTNLYTELHV
jgi:uncharacterized protein